MRVDEIIQFETFITSVIFTDESIELNFLEKREQTDNVMMARTMVIYLEDSETKIQIYSDLQDSLRMLIEMGYIEMRNPPDEFEEPRSWVHSKMLEGD